MTGIILAIDRGKYKSVNCVYRAGSEPSFRTLSSTPETLSRLCLEDPVQLPGLPISTLKRGKPKWRPSNCN